jgi:hypothetical protein
VVVSETPSYHTQTRMHTRTHTSYFLNTSLTTFSLHTTLYSHVTPSYTENDLHLLSFVPVYQCVIFSSMFFTMGNQEFLHCVSSLRQGTSKTGIFHQLSKNAYDAIAPNKLLCRSTTLLLHSRCPKPVQFGDRDPALLRTDIADCWLRKEYSVRLIYEVGTSSNTSKCYTISAGL